MSEELKPIQAEEKPPVEPILDVAPSPHIYDTSLTTRKVMLDVLIALVPLVVWSIFMFRLYAVKQLGISIVACLAFETLFAKMRGRSTPIGDYSAAITGVILGLSLPATTPVFINIIAAGVAIGIGKAVFGGLGFNMFNPAMVGRAFVMLSFARWLGAPAYVDESLGVDALTRATPLSVAKDFMKMVFDGQMGFRDLVEVADQDLFMGYVNGSLGEMSALCILIGGLYLIYRKAAAWQIPLGSIVGLLVSALILNLLNLTPYDMMQHLWSGAFLFGAFFIATDPVSSPLSRKGRFFFGLGYGVLVMILRVFSSYPEGVMFAILIMNAMVPLINRFSVPVPLGGPTQV